MAVVLSCNEIGKSHGARKLFDSLSFTVEDGRRIGVIGPNGSGKTTLLRILAGLEMPDSGVRSVRKLAKVAYVPQDSVFEPGSTVRRVMDAAMADSPLDEAEREVRIGIALGKVGFSGAASLTSALSGGWKKRLSIASQLVGEPDLLLLDEPTNHLDLDGIEWLERLLAAESFACVFVSHDRYFLENVAQEVAEINKVFPDGLFRCGGRYSSFLERREDCLAALSKQQEALANRVRREIEWLRRGPKARTGKSRARIDSAGRMIDELAEVEARGRSGVAALDFTASERKTKRLAVAEKASKALGGETLFRDLDFVLSPGTRLGVVGPNGSGKTTLLRVILGELAPDSGSVTRAANLRAAALDQHRGHLNAEDTLRRTLAPEGDSVQFRGQPMHVAAWAKRFLFQIEQLEQPVSTLSGGERARAAIARLMTEEADLLTLDEPTNDLDIPTLEALEETLLEFPGALVLITHDRYLLDRVCTSIIGLDGDGEAHLYADYLQWEQSREERRRNRATAVRPKPAEAASDVAEKKARKLSYHEQREWDAMEDRILEAEQALESALEEMNNPDGVADPTILIARNSRMDQAQSEVDRLYARWAELEDKVS
jgi:ATP-binding cassette subfamily F protein uup